MLCFAVAFVVLALPPAGEPQPVSAELETEITRIIKKAEIARFERFDGKRYLKSFTTDARWVYGRRAVPDVHDFILDRKAYETRVQWNSWLKSDGQHRVYFRSFELEKIDNEVVVEAEIALFFPTGRSREARRYRLKRKGRQWRIRHTRIWPLWLSKGTMPVDYTDEYWLDADEEAENNLKAPDNEIKIRVSKLANAYWLKAAHAMLKEATTKKPQSAPTWAMRAEVAESIGEMDDARRSAKKALKLDDKVEISPTLRRVGRRRR